MKIGQDSHMMMIDIGSRKNSVPKRSIQACVASRQPAGDDVDADMLVAQQRVAGAEQEHRREQIPLQLEPGVRADVEDVADVALAALTSTAARTSQ